MVIFSGETWTANGLLNNDNGEFSLTAKHAMFWRQFWVVKEGVPNAFSSWLKTSQILGLFEGPADRGELNHFVNPEFG